MSDNSLANLLKIMKEEDQTCGWGAFSVTNRSRLNTLLREQYIQRFKGLNFLPLFSGRMGGADSKYNYIKLKDIALSAPLLAFNKASLMDSSAVMRMDIVSGSCTTLHQPPGADEVLVSTFNILEHQGLTLELDIDLNFVVGEVDRTGKIVINLQEGVSFRCNMGPDEDANKRIAAFFKERFAELSPNRSVFQLGMLDLRGYSSLTPKSFRLATQAAPGAKIQGSANYSDGCVVVAIRLLGNNGPGEFPLPPSFPYFIPDDQENGSDKYSAALVLAREMIPYIENNNLDVLNNLLYPEHEFVERERHTPRDLAIFGNISPKHSLYTLDPAFETIKAGETQRFTLKNVKGEVVQATSWRAVSLGSHTVEGHGTVTAGLYTAPPRARIGHETSHVVVTADYLYAGTTYTASALLRVVFDTGTISPRVTTRSATAATQPVVLTATSLDNAAVRWKLLAPEYGSLTQSGNRGSFTADARARGRGLVVQQIEATGTQTSQASLLLLNAQQQLRVDPPYVAAVKKATVVPLKHDTTLLPGMPRRWKVAGGGGTVDASGRFTAPADGITSSSVVQCEIVHNGIVLSSGYGVINHTELEPEQSWETLSQFTVKVLGGPDMQRIGSLFRNGFQQLRVQITTQTVPVNGKEYPLSVLEKASMRLVAGEDDIEFVDGALDGIPEDDEQVWRTSLVHNRFNLAIPRSAGEDSSSTPSATITVQDMYIHTREKGGATATLHATFQADSNNRWHKSTDRPDINSKIDVTPLEIPQLENEDYGLDRVRVAGGTGNPNPGDPHEDDDFWYHLRTIDYWVYYYKGRPGTFGAKFVTVDFLAESGSEISTTTIRWESEQLAERMFSWTGWIFRDPLRPINTKKIQFDEKTKDVVKSENLDIDVKEDVYEDGKLIITLHRTDDVAYVRPTDPSRAKLSRSLAVLLIDSNGNPHRRRISFLQNNVVGDRNKLVVTAFSPSP